VVHIGGAFWFMYMHVCNVHVVCVCACVHVCVVVCIVCGACVCEQVCVVVHGACVREPLPVPSSDHHIQLLDLELPQLQIHELKQTSSL
jgi:hypothetical protein